MHRWIRLVVFLFFVFPLFSVDGNPVTTEEIDTICSDILSGRSESSEQAEHPDLFGRLAWSLEGERPGVAGVIRSPFLWYQPSLVGGKPKKRSLDTVNLIHDHLLRAQLSIDQPVTVGESSAEDELPPYLQFSDTAEGFYWMVQSIGFPLSPEKAMSGVDEDQINSVYLNDEFAVGMVSFLGHLIGGLLSGGAAGVVSFVVCLCAGCEAETTAVAGVTPIFLGGAAGIFFDKRAQRARHNEPGYVEAQKGAARSKVFFRDDSNFDSPLERDGVPIDFTPGWNRVSEHAFQLARGARRPVPTYYTFVIESDEERLLIVVRFPEDKYVGRPEIAYFIEDK